MSDPIIKWEIDKRAITDISSASITSITEAVIELLTNVDDSYERIANGNKKAYSEKKCLIKYKRGGNHQPSYLEIYDNAEGMSANDIVRNLTIGKYSSGGSTRGHFSKGLKDISIFGTVTLKSIKDNLYSETTFSLQDEGYAKPKTQKATQQHINDLNLKKKNRNGTKIEYLIKRGNRLTHTTFDQLVKDLETHYMLKNILHEQKRSLRVLIQNLNDKSHKPQLLVHKPPLIKKTIFDEIIQSDSIKEYNDFYKPDDEVCFSLYEIEEDKEAPNNHSLCGIYIEGNKQVYSKGFFDMDKNNPYFRRFFGVLRTTLLDKSLEVWRDKTTSDNSKLNPSSIIEPTRRGGLAWQHPLIDKLVKIPKQKLKNYISELDQKNKNIDFHSDSRKLINEISDLIAQEMQEIDDDISSFDKNNIDRIKHGQWLPVPKQVNLYPDEEKNIYVYTQESTLINKSALLTLKIDDEDKQFIHVFNEQSIPTESDEKGKYRFSFKIKALNPVDKLPISFFYDNNFTSKRTELFINVHEFKDREFKKDLEFEFENYSVKYKGNRKIKIFKKFEENDPNEIDVNIMSDNLNNVQPKSNVIKMTRFNKTNYLVGEIVISGINHGGKANVIAETNNNLRDFARVTVQNEKEKQNKHDYDLKPDENITDFKYYW
ncbi:MAG: hypothetical protein ACJ0BR_06315, partial [Candidatus Puniceispirillales bacterium]